MPQSILDSSSVTESEYIDHILQDLEAQRKYFVDNRDWNTPNYTRKGNDDIQFKTNLYLSETGLSEHPSGAYVAYHEQRGLPHMVSFCENLPNPTIFHEYGHVLIMAHSRESGKGFDGVSFLEPWWESMANWLRERYMLHAGYRTSLTSNGYDSRPHQYYSSLHLTMSHYGWRGLSYQYYENVSFLEYLENNPDNIKGLGSGFLKSLIQNARHSTGLFFTTVESEISRRNGNALIKDVLGHFAKRLPTQEIYPSPLRELYQSYWNNNASTFEIVSLSPTTPSILTVPRGRELEQTGIAVIPLHNYLTSGQTTVRVHPDPTTVDGLQANQLDVSSNADDDFRTCIVRKKNSTVTYEEVSNALERTVLWTDPQESVWLTLAATPDFVPTDALNMAVQCGTYKHVSPQPGSGYGPIYLNGRTGTQQFTIAVSVVYESDSISQEEYYVHLSSTTDGDIIIRKTSTKQIEFSVYGHVISFAESNWNDTWTDYSGVTHTTMLGTKVTYLLVMTKVAGSEYTLVAYEGRAGYTYNTFYPGQPENVDINMKTKATKTIQLVTVDPFDVEFQSVSFGQHINGSSGIPNDAQIAFVGLWECPEIDTYKECIKAFNYGPESNQITLKVLFILKKYYQNPEVENGRLFEITQEELDGLPHEYMYHFPREMLEMTNNQVVFESTVVVDDEPITSNSLLDQYGIDMVTPQDGGSYEQYIQYKGEYDIIAVVSPKGQTLWALANGLEAKRDAGWISISTPSVSYYSIFFPEIHPETPPFDKYPMHFAGISHEMLHIIGEQFYRRRKNVQNIPDVHASAALGYHDSVNYGDTIKYTDFQQFYSDYYTGRIQKNKLALTVPNKTYDASTVQTLHLVNIATYYSYSGDPTTPYTSNQTFGVSFTTFNFLEDYIIIDNNQLIAQEACTVNIFTRWNITENVSKRNATSYDTGLLWGASVNGQPAALSSAPTKSVALSSGDTLSLSIQPIDTLTLYDKSYIALTIDGVEPEYWGLGAEKAYIPHGTIRDFAKIDHLDYSTNHINSVQTERPYPITSGMYNGEPNSLSANLTTYLRKYRYSMELDKKW
jgi:hypothetical protein